MTGDHITVYVCTKEANALGRMLCRLIDEVTNGLFTSRAFRAA